MNLGMVVLLGLVVSPPDDCAPQVREAAPRIANLVGSPALVLPAQMWEALDSFDPEFRIRQWTDYPAWVRDEYERTAHQGLFAVVGDFNGDGRTDVVVDGDNLEVGRRLAILSSAGGPAVVEIERIAHIPPAVLAQRCRLGAKKDEGPGLPAGLYHVSAGTYRSEHEEHDLRLSHDAFREVHWEKAASVRYYKDDEFRSYVTAD